METFQSPTIENLISREACDDSLNLGEFPNPSTGIATGTTDGLSQPSVVCTAAAGFGFIDD